MSSLPPSQRASGASSTPPIPPQESAEDLLPPATPPAAASGPVPAPTVDTATLPLAKRPHEIDAANVLLNLYLKKRVEGQLDFYKRRIREFEGNTGFMVSIGAAIMALSAFISAIGATTNSPVLALITAVLPAFAALVAAFRQLYQWEKQSALYRDASLGLQEAALIVPDEDVYDKRVAKTVFETLVKSSEDVFMAEINQWGQIALGLASQEDQDKLNAELRSLEIQDRKYGQYGGASTEAAPGGESPRGANFNDGGVG